MPTNKKKGNSKKKINSSEVEQQPKSSTSTDHPKPKKNHLREFAHKPEKINARRLAKAVPDEWLDEQLKGLQRGDTTERDIGICLGEKALQESNELTAFHAVVRSAAAESPRMVS